MKKAEAELERQVAEWFEKAEAIDRYEDEQYGKDRRGDELPTGLRISRNDWKRYGRRKPNSRLKQRTGAEATAKVPGRAQGGTPSDKAQKNFTDPENRMMKGGDGFVQARDGQAAVDAQTQVFVAQGITNSPPRRAADGPGAGADSRQHGSSGPGTIRRCRLLLRGELETALTSPDSWIRATGKMGAWPVFTRDRSNPSEAVGTADVPSAPTRRLSFPLPTKETNRRACIRTNQTGPRLQTVSSPWTGQRGWRVESALHCSQHPETDDGNRIVFTAMRTIRSTSNSESISAPESVSNTAITVSSCPSLSLDCYYGDRLLVVPV